MTTTTARVDVLTAEVRVLMVGSRQVTLSVHAQLDQVEPGDIEPFGRVAPRDADRDCVYVVGASARAADRGTLVRSYRACSATVSRAAKARRRDASAARERARIGRERDRVAADVAEADRARAEHGPWRQDRDEQWGQTRDQLLRRHSQLAGSRAELDRRHDELTTMIAGYSWKHRDSPPRILDAADYDREAAALEADVPGAESWEALPLIVLAGLR